ncbi:MAG: 3-methyl-2-oxobutanoate hydroxymethyltransferase [Acidimicrobiia bacterium]|nr:3-methyl-2-oxobutanoate hydroxymethyltransferase [bacterium]MXX01794.1 3-methyl-2-oxobutanoate hydroxymethyltransferase [Acidimicrobiia bacterium]MDE0675138.1 3-methyl-2-oxobutanoate hydroxymethyltransferase [bacterium]MXX45023.1 3-methyl-2-oxobutanoate hydroxymethyltransferase [Acidimicrobiia bacterium]MXY74532.1 3-methyl-2-oxobutanoate hydroxymethyltransferase [Acidimicrobiia bacterium]
MARVTVPSIRARKGIEKIAMVTAYDYPGAKLASEAGIDIILVGDSAANAVHGFDNTLSMSLEMMTHHVGAVARAKPHSLVVADMPWMSFHLSPDETVRNAATLIRAGAEAVKIEGGSERVPHIERLLAAEIPVMGHLGLTPQSIHAEGGYRIQGRRLDTARQIIQDAQALDETGIFALVLEGIPEVVTSVVTERVSAPTIGIGAGISADGQVLVFHDLLGLGFGSYPKFVRQYANLRAIATDALRRYCNDVRAGRFPSRKETYNVDASLEEALSGDTPSNASFSSL